MSFFLVDDGFSSHEKVSRLLESSRPDRANVRYVALSLWVLAGSECARRRCGGRVSRILARTLLCTTGRVASQAADLLVEVGLWDRAGDGYVFHDWADRQRPRDRQNGGSTPAANQQPTGSEPAGGQREAGSPPVGDTQDASGTQVASHGSQVVSGTSDTTPLSSSSLLFHDPDARGSTPDPVRRQEASLVQANHDAIAAYREGIADATQRRVPVAHGGRFEQAAELLAVIAETLPEATPAERLALIRQAAAEAARDPDHRKANTPFAWFARSIGKYVLRVGPVGDGGADSQASAIAAAERALDEYEALRKTLPVGPERDAHLKTKPALQMALARARGVL